MRIATKVICGLMLTSAASLSAFAATGTAAPAPAAPAAPAQGDAGGIIRILNHTSYAQSCRITTSTVGTQIVSVVANGGVEKSVSTRNPITVVCASKETGKQQEASFTVAPKNTQTMIIR